MAIKKHPLKTSPEGFARYGEWLQAAYEAAQLYNGSETANEKLLRPLIKMDEFIRAKNNGQSSDSLEMAFATAALPRETSSEKPLTISGILNEAALYYDRIQHIGLNEVIEQLRHGGALVIPSAKTFVLTDEGKIQSPSGEGHNFEIKTQPRLAMLIKHLKELNIFTSDLILRPCAIDPRMMRQHPYVLVQIPHLDKEIAVCEQVGEITFVGQRIIGPDLWQSLSKDQLKARPDIMAVMFHSENSWWEDIKTILKSAEQKPKTNLAVFARKKPPLDLDLIKQSLLAHYRATGAWLSKTVIGPSGKSGSYILEHGPYAGRVKTGALDASLAAGFRGLPGGSSIAALNAELSSEHNLDYKNHLDQKDLNPDLVKQSLLAHYRATGTWLSCSIKAPDGKKGSYILEHGPYAGQTTAGALDAALSTGARSLPGGSSIAALNAELSREHNLDYKNFKNQDELDLDLIKQSLLVHRRATGTWLSCSTKAPDGKKSSYILEHGPYAGQISANNLNAALSTGTRGLPGGSSIAKLNAELSDEHNLDYKNVKDQVDLDLDLIKQSLLAHRLATGTWLSVGAKTPNGKRVNYFLEHGPYAGQMTAGALDACLAKGSRGLPGGSSIAKLNREIQAELAADPSADFPEPV